MDFGLGGIGSSSDQEDSNFRSDRGRYYHRHNEIQIQHLEAVFKECPNPDENQRNQLSRELGLESQQIKFWFQNKRSQTRAQNERVNNTCLKDENEKIYCENLAMKESLKNLICTACDGSPSNTNENEEQKQHCLESLKLQNALLKAEHAKVACMVSMQTGRPTSQLVAPPVFSRQPIDALTRNFSTQNLNFPSGSSGNPSLSFPIRGISGLEESHMVEAANGATKELLHLIRTHEPLWVEASRGKYVLDREHYGRSFPNVSHCRSSFVRFESSKNDCLVTLGGKILVEMFIDPNKWVDVFHTIVAKASTVHVHRNGGLANNNSSLQLMYVQMHTLSPLVAPREMYILRCCQQIDLNTWVISDVSYECSISQYTSPSRCWRLPSGCLIEDMSNGFSKVTWVEHVEADDKTLSHRLYRELASNGELFGAERWTITLQRMCQRFTFSVEESTSTNGFGEEGKRSMKKVAHKMVKSFCAMLCMPGKMEFSYLNEVNSSGVQVSIRKATELAQPSGMIVSASTSLSLPLLPQELFNFFWDHKTRSQWDTLCNENHAHEVIRIANGPHPGNSISVIQPYTPNGNQMLILQESTIDQLGSMIVYASVDISSINLAISGEDTSDIYLLPSGVIISRKAHAETASTAPSSSEGPARSSSDSLLTVVFQVHVSTGPSSNQVDPESVSTVTTLLSSTVQRIKVALGCGYLD